MFSVAVFVVYAYVSTDIKVQTLSALENTTESPRAAADRAY